MKTTLLVLAAGMGSRYGGMKQLDSFGPSGETIMDYSIYDALDAGFNKIVFVIRRSFQAEFETRFVKKLRGKAEVILAFQELDNLPASISIPAARQKPWGTGHAIWVARDFIQEPFAVINADDFYSREAFSTMASFLKRQSPLQKNFAMCGFRLVNTLSPYGTVARGLCTLQGNFLKKVEEHTKIMVAPDGLITNQEAGNEKVLNPVTTVSMNFWGFTPYLFPFLEEKLIAFLEEKGQESDSEFYIPMVVDQLIGQQLASVEVLPCNARWFGITYHEDKQQAVNNIRQLVDMKIYPERLWYS